MSFVKYRVKEVAADFGKTPKEIAEIISRYYEKPKSNTQVLNDAELNALFDDITRNNQIQSLEQVFAVPSAPKAEAPKAETPKAEAPKAETPKAEAPSAAPAKTPAAQPNRAQQAGRPQNAAQSRPQNNQPKAEAPKAVKQPEPESDVVAWLLLKRNKEKQL